MKIAVASGKGGTGKSTISTNFAYILSKSFSNLALLDCDVEEPNCHIFLKPDFTATQKVEVITPKINTEKCIACGKCAQVCQFNALAFIKNKVLVFDELCHSCSSCNNNCPANAIEDSYREVGVIESGTAYGFDFVHGKSRIGEAMSPPLIKAVKNYTSNKNYDVEILDCPPGTSCPVISAVDGVDFVVMVTEPTPFGLYDLKLAVDVMKKLELPFGVVINRSSENDILIESWAEKERINIITKIPDNRKIAECYSKGDLVLENLPEFENNFMPLINLVKELHTCQQKN